MPGTEEIKSFALSMASEFVKREQEDLFTEHGSFVQRVLAVSSSCASIVFCVAAMYMFLAIDPRRLVFRHQLIFFLIFYDLLKACILLLYPSRVLTRYTAYYNDRFCQIVGFFTVTAIEGADIAILSFAVHTFLLIFKPGLTVKVHNSDRTEGGLYRYRFMVYGLSFFIPTIMASLAFCYGKGYYPYVCWCYLPQRPLWSRLVLSWIPRYIIVIIIFAVYGAIYIHVIREFKTLGGVWTTIHKLRLHNGLHPNASHEKPSFYSALKYFLATVKDHIFPHFIIPDEEVHKTNSNNNLGNSASKDSKLKGNSNKEPKAKGSTGNIHIDTEDIVFDPEIQAANLENFRKRQKIIEKQMKSIFIYPFAYCFVWLFPFILQCTQFNYEQHHKPIYWLNCMGAFMQPFNGFIDTLVFFYREQPWEYTIMKNFEKEHQSKMDNIVMNTSGGGAPSNDNESDATSARLTKNSISASLGVDINQYPRWRHYLSWLRLPFLKLPTEDNITKFQVKYLNNKIEEIKNIQNDPHRNSTKITNRDTAISKHDFSNVLSGDLTEKDFRTTFEGFSLNFGNDRRSSLSSLTQIGEKNQKNQPVSGDASNSSNGSTVNGVSSSSSSSKDDQPNLMFNNINYGKPSAPQPAYKANKPRHISIADPNEPVIFEGKRYKGQSTNNSPQSNNETSTRPHSQVFANSATANAINLLNSIQQQRKSGGGTSTNYNEPTSPTSPNNNSGSNNDTPKRTTSMRQQFSGNRNDHRNSYASNADTSDDDDMDFLEFLRKGP